VALGESFTVLAVFEALDKMSVPIERMDASLDRFSETALRSAETASAAGAKVDESLLKTASGADALDLASARVAGAEAKLAAATSQQAEAEKALLAAREAAVSEDELAAASDGLAKAQRNAAKAAAELKDAQAVQVATQKAAKGETETNAAALSALSRGAGIAALGVAAAGGLMVKAAGDFQDSTQHLVTDAGESQANLHMVQQGILDVATATGTSASKLSDAMYHIESAGYHGSQGLTLLKVAAEGAKVGGADFETVAKTLTGTMNAYNMTGDQATSMMNALIATVGAGDMRMQDLASSLGNVAPLAAAAGISFDQVGGAIATMTAQNMSAQQASQDLANTIRSLSNVQGPARDEMQAMGVDANDVSQNLGKRGLTGTLEILTTAIAQHTQGGQVFVDTLKDSKNAAADARTMLGQLPASIQGAAQKFLDGSITIKDFNKDIQNLPPQQEHLAKQFELLVGKTDSFNKLLTSGSPAAETMNASLSKMLGGATGLNTALMLTGGRMETFKDSTHTVADALNKGGGQVENWDKIQGTFNQQLDRAKTGLEAAGITLGTMLLPAVTKVASAVADAAAPMAQWISQHEKLVGLIGTVVGVIAAGIGVIKAIELATKAWAAAQALLDAAMDANPIGLLVIAVAALVAGVIYAWDHFATFREVVTESLHAVEEAGMAVWHALEAAWNGISSAAESLWHFLEGVWNGVVHGVESLWHSVEQVWNTVWGVTEKVWGAISGFFTKWWPLLLLIFAAPIALLIGAWNHFHQAIEDTAKTVWNAVSGFFKGIWDDIVNGATTIWNLFYTYVIEPNVQLWHEIESIWDTVMGVLARAWDEINGLAAAAWNLVYEYVIRPVKQIWNDVVAIFGEVNNAIVNKLDEAWHSVERIGDKFLDIGKNIVMGIVHGVEDAAGYLVNALGNVASDALKGAKSLLGIKSPSTVFADQVGKWIPHGIAQGILDHAKVAQDAMSSVSLSLPGVAFGGASPGAGQGAGVGIRATPGGASPPINIDMRGAHLMTDQDINGFAQKIGRLITTNGLPGGGVRIAM
jgi:TP901 family phage tail tape measure protein